MSRKQKAKTTGESLMNDQGETVVLWKATKPLSAEEHAIVASMVRSEQEHSGVKIILVPYSVDAEAVQHEGDPVGSEVGSDQPGPGGVAGEAGAAGGGVEGGKSADGDGE